MFDAVILGAGAAGLVCAIQAARRGLSVCLLERNDRAGKKILQTGNGRCNLSNLDMGASHFHGAEASFVRPALDAFGIDTLKEFFELIGMPLTALPDGRIYPHSLQAKTVRQTLEREVERLGVTVVKECYCKHAELSDGVLTAYSFDNRPFKGRNLVLATGGTAMKRSGSDGSGYALAERFGHTVAEPFAGIVALTLSGRAHRAMNGVKIPSKCRLYIDDTEVRADEGDILFTDYGISGPPVLQLSRHAHAALRSGRRAAIGVSMLLDDWADPARISQYLSGREGLLTDVLALILHDKTVAPLMKAAGIREDAQWHNLNPGTRESLVRHLTDWRFEISGTRPMESAQVSCGGVRTEEVEPHTMASKKVKGLYMIGELLDVDGDCGGYNLHWAFASATLCAKAL